MKEGDVGTIHGPKFFGIGRVTDFHEISFGLVRRADHWEYWEYYEPEEGEPIGPRIFEERIDAPSREIAMRCFEAILNRRHPPPGVTLPEAVSNEAVRAREAVLTKTDFGPVLTAINAQDPALAAKLYADIDTALSTEPNGDEPQRVAHLRKLLKHRQPGKHRWQLLLVAHWDELMGKTYGEISLWLKQDHGIEVTTAAVAKFIQLLRVKRKKTTK